MIDNSTRVADDEVSVSVIIPFYGDPDPTLTLVRTLTDAPSRHLREVIVSDDCSPMPFPATPKVNVFRKEENRGFASAVNFGAAHATGDLLLILNSDLSLTPGFIDDLVARSRAWMPALASVRLMDPDGRTSHVGRHFPKASHYVSEWLLPLSRLRHLRIVQDAVGHDTVADGSHDEVVDWVVGALMLVPRAAFFAVGGMDERFYMNSEEVDLQRRLRSIGIPSVVLGSLGVTHEGGGSSESNNRTGWMLDGRRRYEHKWNGRRGILALEAGMLSASCVNFVWNTFRAALGRQSHPTETIRTQYNLIRRPEQWVPEQHRVNISLWRR